MPYFVNKQIPIEVVQQTEPFTVQTLEGELTGKAGDYLATGVRGEQYPIDKDIFEETYYEVTKDVFDEYHSKNSQL